MSLPIPSALRPVANRVFGKARRITGAALRRKQQGPYQGYLDGMSHDGLLRGWVIDRRTGRGRVPVALYAGDKMIEIGYANVVREDVRGATGGEVECGFVFPLSESAFEKIRKAEGHISVRTHEDKPRTVGSMTLTVDHSDPKLAENDITACRIALKDECDALFEALEDVPEPEGDLPPIHQPAFESHGRMFNTDKLIPDVPHSGHPAYLDYVRYRYRMDESYAVEPGLESKDQYLYWYLTAYRAQEKRRVPLSRELIDYLNEPIVMAGQTFSISRIMWWRMTGRPDMMGSVNLNDRDSYLNTLFWWAHQDSPYMYFEDCLVPNRFADLLRGVHPSRRLDAYPLSYFTERYFQNSPRLHFLRPGSAQGRKLLVLAMLLAAFKRPDLLRYIPRNSINALLDPDETGTSAFERFLNDLHEVDDLRETEGTDTSLSPQPPIRMSRARYTALLRTRFFDLDSYMFMTRDSEGNRFEAAAMTISDPDRKKVDVQLIGPLAKASGLGQATRLSAAILRETDLSVRGVDFDLDNPAPEGFSSDTLIEDYGPAKINIIHLNAESTPLAYAYQPDVFSGAYNIGYFFWELDQPAYCHYLGMDLLDEIWVSTEYGVEIYKPDAGDKPVVNVGMCYEDNTDITREDSRAFVNRRFQFDDSYYVCLVAFDSFSFVQRKNPVSVLKAFQKAFDGVPEARLIVKTQNRDSVFDPVQVQLWDRVDAITSADPRIIVMNETLSYRDLLRLKCGSDCYISLHKSEGWGFGMIEAMNLRVPVVCTAYSGNMDFCSEDTAWLVNYEERALRQGEYIFVRKDAKWAEPSVEHAAAQLRAAYDNPAARAQKAEAAYSFIRDNFSTTAISRRYGSRLHEILKGL
jgi:glycosyltransferase involved in cell wall biosynthesis